MGEQLNTSTCVSVCVGVSLCRCVSVCQQWRLQDANMLGCSQPGWMNCGRLCRRKALVYLSALCCERPGALTQISGCSHTLDCMGGQRAARSGKATRWNENVCS